MQDSRPDPIPENAMSLHPFYRSVVAMFCGPHDEGDSVPTRRIDRAIELSLELCSPLLIAGDGNHGHDVRLFVQRAQDAGVLCIRMFYDRPASTITDARAVANELINNPPFMSVKDIYLVTDDWHMARAATILEGELHCTMAHNQPTIRCVRVTTGPRPPAEILHGERQGLVDYLAGRYVSRIAHPPYGKPCEARP